MVKYPKTSMVALTGALVAFAQPAAAQVGGIASASPTVAIARTKALQVANTQIQTTYKANLDKMEANERARQVELAKLDTNGDKQVDDAELAAAEKAKSPALTQAETLSRDTQAQSAPVFRAQAYAIEQVAMKYDPAQKQVVTAKKINLILSPEAFLYAPDSVDVTEAITAEIDRVLPTVSIAAPADWRPQRTTVQLQQQIQQIQQVAAYQQAAAQAQAQQGQAAPTVQPTPPADSGR